MKGEEPPSVMEQQASLDDELRILREIEDEVQSILKRSKSARREMGERIHYFKLSGPDKFNDVWKAAEEMDAILVSLDGLGLNDLRMFVTELKKRVSDESIYLIRWPILLILPKHMRLVVHG